jgi:hypothetical protein
MERLGALLQRADAANGDARRAATGELNTLLGQMPRYASRPVADLLLRWLDQGALSDLQDGEGQTARAAATAAVLSMGYPYALEINPNDLDHLRSHSAPGARRGGPLAAFLMVTVTSGFALLPAFAPGAHAPASGFVLLGAMFGSALGLLLSRPRGPWRRWALIALLLSGLTSMSMAFTGTSMLFAPAIGSIAAFSMAWRRDR